MHDKTAAAIADTKGIAILIFAVTACPIALQAPYNHVVKRSNDAFFVIV
jgi:hypothetical protein